MSIWERHKLNFFKYGHIYATIFGLVVVNYKPTRPSNTISHRCAVVYSHLLMVLLALVLPIYFVYNLPLLLETTDQSLKLLLVVSFGNTLIKYVTVVVTYCANLAHYDAIRQLTIRRQQLEDEFAQNFAGDERIRQQFERMCILKFTLINTVIFLQLGNIWYLWWTDANAVRVQIAIYTFVLWNYTENMADYFYFVNLSCCRFYQQLNQQLLQLVREAKLLYYFELCGQRSGTRMQLCCLLSDQVDALATVCQRIHRLYFGSVTLHQFQILGLVFTTLISNLTNSFMLFNLFKKNSLSQASPAIALNTLHALAYYVDTYIVAQVSENVNVELHEIGNTMQKFSQLAKLDVRLEQSVEQFSMHLQCSKAGLRICGLFDLDRRLTYLTATTALSYFITLIQFDMNLTA